MLMPKRVKYRKAQRGRMKGKAQRGSSLAFGEYGLKALEPGWVSNRQIEAAPKAAPAPRAAPAPVRPAAKAAARALAPKKKRARAKPAKETK